MVKKWSKTKFSEIGKSHYLSSHYNYFILRKIIDSDTHFLEERISDYFYIISGFAFSSKDYTEQGVSVCRIGDISKEGKILHNKMKQLPKKYSQKHTDYLIKENDILIGMTGDGKYFKTGLIENLENNILLNQRVGLLRLKNKAAKFNPKFLAYLFKLDKVQNQIKIVAMGKTQKNISPFDILNIKFPKISIKNQNKIINAIIPIEGEIKLLENNKKETNEIINNIFAQELNFDSQKFNRLKKQQKFKSSLQKFSNNIDCRYSFKFHNTAGKYVYDFLCSTSNKRIKNFILEPIVLGKGVSPKDYDQSGEYYYIAMSSIKTLAFEPKNCKKLKIEYWSNNLNKSVQVNDIILARSGEGTIGKVALIEQEGIKAIFSDFTQRIRLINYNQKLAYYYFRSDLFQYMVYTNKKGLGNNTNIFPSQIQEFPIPDWTKAKQNKIAKKINAMINNQNEIDYKIKIKQNEINNLIENAINKKEER